jgi:hypothetical protein
MIWEQQLHTQPLWWIEKQKIVFEKKQQTREDLRKWQVQEVLFQSIPHPAKSASEKPIRSSEEEAEYQIPNSGVCLRYLKIH